MSLDPRVVLITGAAGHLGRAVVERFAQTHHHLVLLGRDAAALERSFGAHADWHFAGADLADAASTAAAVQAATQRFGGTHILCHLAGGFRMGEAVHATSDDTWQVLLDINARTLLHITRAVVPTMLARGAGKIVTVGAAAALKGGAQMGAYAASKSSVIRLSEAMSAELRERNINVNCVLPTIIDTPDNRSAMPDADPARWVAPQALADVIAFLASDAARAVHGAALPVSGLS